MKTKPIKKRRPTPAKKITAEEARAIVLARWHNPDGSPADPDRVDRIVSRFFLSMKYDAAPPPHYIIERKRHSRPTVERLARWVNLESPLEPVTADRKPIRTRVAATNPTEAKDGTNQPETDRPVTRETYDAQMKAIDDKIELRTHEGFTRNVIALMNKQRRLTARYYREAKTPKPDAQKWLF
jgi:hypothetical protein